MRRLLKFLFSPHLWALALYGAVLYLLLAPTAGIYFWLGHEEYHPLLRMKWMADLWRVYGPFHTPWFPEVCWGYGWPFFTFYAPLGYYVGTAGHFIFGLSFGQSAKLSFHLSLLVGGLLIYLFTQTLARREKWPRAPWWGVAAATLYTLAPYHLTDVFARASLAESWGFATVPGVFWAIEFSRRRPRAGVLLVALMFNLVILSHNITAIYCALFAMIYVVLTGRRLLWQWLVIFGFLIGLGLSAYYWLPANVLKKDVAASNPGLMVMTPEHIAPHAVFWQQHLTDRFAKGASDGSPYDNFGIMMGRLILFALLASVVALFSRGFARAQRYRLFCLLLMTGITLVFCSPQMPWHQVPEILRFVQFPWRILLFVDFFACAAMLAASPVLNRWIHPTFLTALAALMYIPQIGPTLDDPYMSDQVVINSEDELMSKYFVSSEMKMHYAGSVVQEYRPGWVKGDYILSSFHTANPAPASRLTPLKGDILIAENGYSHKGTAYYWTYRAPEGAIVRIHMFDFPGWELYIDKQRVENRIGRDEDGLLKLTLPPGEHTAKLVYTISPIGRFARRITMASWLLLLVLAAALLMSRRLRRAGDKWRLLAARVIAALPGPEESASGPAPALAQPPARESLPAAPPDSSAPPQGLS